VSKIFHGFVTKAKNPLMLKNFLFQGNIIALATAVWRLSSETKSFWPAAITKQEIDPEKLSFFQKVSADPEIEFPDFQRALSFKPKTETLLVCPLCEGRHSITACKDFSEADVEFRRRFVTKMHLCQCCLGAYHSSRQCKQVLLCGIDGCDKTHHPMLHSSERDTSEKNDRFR
jgi:hypothetical protein